MDLTTSYMGLTLQHPLVPSASPLSKELDGVRQLEDAGASAVVLASLFEEQIRMELQMLNHYLDFAGESVGEVSSYFPDVPDYGVGPEAHLDFIARAKQALDIPIIGSLNCCTNEGWMTYPKLFESAGADAIELNLYHIPTDPEQSGQDVEQTYLQIVKDVKEQIRIPLSVKLHPFFSSLPNMAKKLSDCGADALVLFNRFYQPDFDLEKLEVVPNLVLSRSEELRLPLRWTSILFGRIPTDLAITSGIHNHIDLLKAMMAGARVGMVASELLQNGTQRIGEILTELRQWMETNEYPSIQKMQGSMSHKHIDNPSTFERANYMKVLQSFSPDPTGQMM